MLVAVDIGNTRIKAGMFEGATLSPLLSEPVEILDSPEETARLFKAFFNLQPRPDRIGMSSVVPGRTQAAVDALVNETGTPVEQITPKMRLPIDLAYETPHTLGTDRLCVAAAAWEMFSRGKKGSVIAISAGSAVTYEVIEIPGIYRGGAITAGPELIRSSLTMQTGQLPDFDLDLPDSPIGTSTDHALKAGVVFSFIDSVAAMIERLKGEVCSEEITVVATGGWCDMLKRQVPSIDLASPNLVLHGIRLILELNDPPSPPAK